MEISKREPLQNTSFADFLRHKRSELIRSRPNKRHRISGITQDEAALGMGISPASYRALEGSGAVNPTLDTLFRVQDYYQIPDDLFWSQLVPNLRSRVLEDRQI